MRRRCLAFFGSWRDAVLGRSLVGVDGVIVRVRRDADFSRVQRVAALDRAARFGLRAEVLEGAEGESVESYGRRVFDVVRDAGADTVVLAGFLKKLWIPADFAGRVINIHPSLLPAFGGKGYFGMNVHRAVLERGCQVSGCTVHLVDEVYDNGPILLQRWCAVEPEDSPEDLAARVFQEELLALPEALRRFWRR